MQKFDFDKCSKRCDFKLNVADKNDLDYEFIEKFKGALIRSEYVIRDSGYYITQDNALKEVLGITSSTAEKFKDNDVWYRVSEFTTSEANSLIGVDEILTEKNEMCGLRGVRRSLRYPDAFRKELKSIIELMDSHTNVGLLFSMVHDAKQAKKITDILGEFDYERKTAIMLEVPSVIIMFDEVRQSFDNFIVGLNDLTTFVLGADRHLKGVYDRTHPAVRCLITDLLKKQTKDKPIELAGYIRQKEAEMGLEIGFKSMYLRVQDLPSIFGGFDKYCIKDRPYNRKKHSSPNVSELP